MDAATRFLWFALMLLFSLLVGGVAGLLVWADSNALAAAFLTGGGTFGGTLLLLLAVFHFLNADKKAN
jgi:hypothetical protein